MTVVATALRDDTAGLPPGMADSRLLQRLIIGGQWNQEFISDVVCRPEQAVSVSRGWFESEDFLASWIP